MTRPLSKILEHALEVGGGRRKEQIWRQAMRLATSEQLIHSQAPPLPGLGAALERWLRPAVGFARPRNVLKDPLLGPAEKRAILSSWASDASAVKDEPTLRWLLGTSEPVPLTEIREALHRLDLWESADDAPDLQNLPGQGLSPAQRGIS
jgi:hypothetical protein